MSGPQVRIPFCNKWTLISNNQNTREWLRDRMWGPEKNLHCPSHLWHKKIRQTVRKAWVVHLKSCILERIIPQYSIPCVSELLIIIRGYLRGSVPDIKKYWLVITNLHGSIRTSHFKSILSPSNKTHPHSPSVVTRSFSTNHRDFVCRSVIFAFPVRFLRCCVSFIPLEKHPLVPSPCGFLFPSNKLVVLTHWRSNRALGFSSPPRQRLSADNVFPVPGPWTPLIGLLSHTSVALVRPRGAGIHSFAVAWFQ